LANIPAELKYTPEHEWVRVGSDGTAEIGITDYAQGELGDVVYVELPKPGAALAAGSVVGEIESTKSVSELYSPVSGTVVEINQAAVEDPSVVNSDPYGQGWLLKVDVASTGPLLTDANTRGDWSGTVIPRSKPSVST